MLCHPDRIPKKCQKPCFSFSRFSRWFHVQEGFFHGRFTVFHATIFSCFRGFSDLFVFVLYGNIPFITSPK